MGPTILNGLSLLKLPSPVKESLGYVYPPRWKKALGYVYGKTKPPSEDDPTHSDWKLKKLWLCLGHFNLCNNLFSGHL